MHLGRRLHGPYGLEGSPLSCAAEVDEPLVGLGDPEVCLSVNNLEQVEISLAVLKRRGVHEDVVASEDPVVLCERDPSDDILRPPPLAFRLGLPRPKHKTFRLHDDRRLCNMEAIIEPHTFPHEREDLKSDQG